MTQAVYDAIEAIAATSSKIEKESLIKQAGSDPVFMRTLKAAYDPFLTYGVRLVPAGVGTGKKTLEDESVWLLLAALNDRTLSGDDARNALRSMLLSLDKPSSTVLARIVNKDLRAGFSEGSINRVFKGYLPEFPYMRCSLPDKSDMPKWKWEEGVFSQEKADGMFVNVNVDVNRAVHLTTRQGSPVSADALGLYDVIAKTLKPDTQSHGEVVIVLDDKVLPREVGNGILNSVLQGGELPEGHTAQIALWDQIPLSEVKSKNKYAVPYQARLRELAMQIKTLAGNSTELCLVPTRIVRSKKEAYAHYRELLRDGKEGTVCKAFDAIWRDGTSKQQVKLKLEVDVDLAITNVVQGTPGTKNDGRPGSLECRTSCGGLIVNVTVKNEKMRDQIEADPDAWIDRVIAVRANSVMAPSDSNEFHSLFLPRFVEDAFRTDKSVADTLEEVEAQFRNAVEGVTRDYR